MSLRFRSLEDLGRGAWRIASVTPLSTPKEKLALRDASAVAPGSADSRHHGKHLEDFRRDRVRQNLLVISGWRVLRFAAGDIRKDLASCLDSIQALLETIRHEQD